MTRQWASIPISLSNLTLANTLPVGQSFLWHRYPVDSDSAGVDLVEAKPCAESAEPKISEEFSRAIDNPPRVVRLRQSSSHLYFTAIYPDAASEAADRSLDVTRRWLHDYFQLDHDLDKLYAEWTHRDPDLFGRTHIGDRAVGVRLLRQDPWECLVAFITSTNNHITRIGSLMHKLTREYSPPLLESNGRTYHLFPPPHVLPSVLESRLRELGFGYRAAFLESSLTSLRLRFGDGPGQIETGLLAWRTTEIDTVREQLLGLKGVGRKVADCVMLMCLDQLDLIPVDTHVAAIAARHPSFPNRLKGKPMSVQIYDETRAFLAERWGPLGGWAQAVMFAADLKPPATPKRTMSKPEVKLESPAVSLASIDTPSQSHHNLSASPSPLKRKPELTEFRRTRSATRLDLKRSDSDRLLVKVEGLNV